MLCLLQLSDGPEDCVPKMWAAEHQGGLRPEADAENWPIVVPSLPQQVPKLIRHVHNDLACAEAPLSWASPQCVTLCGVGSNAVARCTALTPCCCAPQDNSIDCGLFVLAYLHFFLFSPPPQLTAEYVTNGSVPGA